MIRSKMICCAVVIAILIVDAGAQTFSCDPSISTSLCPGTVAKCTCTVTSNVSTTQWSFTGPNNAAYCTSLFLTQAGGGNCGSSAGSCGPSLQVANQPPVSSSSPCQNSTLTITATSNISGVVASCLDLVPNTVIGSVVITILASPSPVGNIRLNSPSVDQLTAAWAPPITGGVPTSYNVSINDSSNKLVPIPANGPLQNTFTGLTSDTLYTVSVVAINCAGTSSVTSANRTLAVPPDAATIQMVSVFNPNNTLRQLEIYWTPVRGSVTMYTVRVVGNGTSVGPTTTTCTTSPCLYVQQVYVPATSYTIFVASINGDGAVGPESNATINGTTTSSISISVFPTTATINCAFLDGSSYFCVVCCSSDPSVPASSKGYLSSINGSSVNVSDLQSLGSNGQLYYCKAAPATNTNSASCGGPVVGGVKVFFTFTTPSMTTQSTPSSTTQLSSPANTGAIVGGVVGGVGGVILLAVVIAIVVVVVWKKKGGNSGEHKSKEDRVELQKSGGTAERSIPSHDTGALYQDPNAIKRAEGPAGDMYAVADKPKTKGGAPADGGGALYQDPKDIEHTRGPAGEVYAVADKKPKEVPHQPAPTGDMYAVADTKKPSKRK